jgi:hypothetical protein
LTAATPKETTGGRPLTVNACGRVVGTSSLLLWQVLTDAYRRLGFDAMADEAFRAMVLARIVEPTSPGWDTTPQVQERLAALFGVTDGWPCHSRPVGWSSP